MSTELARVGDRIEHGQPIPANVRAVRDAQDTRWSSTPGEFRLGVLRNEDCDSEWWPLTVTEVDPEPQPAECHAHGAHPHGNAWCQGCPACRPVRETGEVLPPVRSRELRVQYLDEAREADDFHLMKALGVDQLDEVMPAIERHNALIARLLDITGVDKPVHLAAAVQNLVTAFRTASAAPDPSQPVVLRLDDEPAGAVAVVGVKSGTRWERTPVNGGRWQNVATLIVRDWIGVLEREREVTVEFAPPREPRTWPKIDPLPDDISAKLTVKGISGPWLRVENVSGGVALYRWRGTGQTCTLLQLRALGAVTEVIEP